MNKRKKYGIIFSIIVLIVVFVIAFVSSIEIDTSYNKINTTGTIEYRIDNTKIIRPVNYGSNNVYIWLVGITIMSILLYASFINIKKKNINKPQIIVLAIVFPVIIFISFLSIVQLLNISTLADSWFLTVVMLIIISIYEYDLFGNRTIINLFDFKLLIKIIVFSIILFFIIGILGELIPSFKKTTTSPITKEQYENYKGKKFDWTKLKTTEELFGEDKDENK